jgi:hypothetical protein
MAGMSDVSACLLRTGVVLGSVLIAQTLTARHLSREDIPPVLRSRVDLSSRVRPWLFGLATVLVLAALVLTVE